MQDLYGGGGDSWWRSSGWRKRRARRGRVSLTQYLESQENQNMTRLLNFTRIQEKRRDEVFIVVVEKIWTEDHLMRVDKESRTYTLF